MLDLGWPELLVVALVLIIVVGPKDLPAMLRTFGRTTKKLRSMAGEFRSQFDEALKEAELDDVKDVLNEARQLNPTNILKDVVDPIKDAGNEIKSDLDKAMKEPAKTEAKSELPVPDFTPADKKNASADAAKPLEKTAANGKPTATKKAAPRKSAARKPAASKSNGSGKTAAAAKKATATKKAAGSAASRKKTTTPKTTKASGDAA